MALKEWKKMKQGGGIRFKKGTKSILITKEKKGYDIGVYDTFYNRRTKWLGTRKTKKYSIELAKRHMRKN